MPNIAVLRTTDMIFDRFCILCCRVLTRKLSGQYCVWRGRVRGCRQRLGKFRGEVNAEGSETLPVPKQAKLSLPDLLREYSVVQVISKTTLKSTKRYVAHQKSI